MRSDVHKPSAINPADYEWVGFEMVQGVAQGDLGACEMQLMERARIRTHMARTGGTYSTHAHGGNCMVCGNANAIYTVLFYHAKTNTYVRMGQDCAQKTDMSYGDLNRFREGIQNHLKAQAGKKKAKAILDGEGLSEAWVLYEAQYSSSFRFEENTIRDIVGKLVTYGEISEKQARFIRNLLERLRQRPELEAKRAAENAAAAPCPIGRQKIEGTVLSLRTDDTPYGLVTKMLVRAKEGYKVWGSRTANAKKGDQIRFVATVQPSPDDPKFGFFSRPAKGEVLQHVETGA